MEERTESERPVVDELCDALRYLGDASYAILPRDMAHAIGDLKKSFWSNVKTVIDKEINWTEERVAGGDRLREDWRQKWNCDKSEGAPEPTN